MQYRSIGNENLIIKRSSTAYYRGTATDRVSNLQIKSSAYHFGLSSSLISTFLFSGCGSSSETDLAQPVPFNGLIDTYKPPMPNFVEPLQQDQYFLYLKPASVSPYWVDSLIMDNADPELSKILGDNHHQIHFSFPELKPSYLHSEILGWESANNSMKEASRAIFLKTNAILDISIIETDDSLSSNVIAISKSSQTITSGLVIFPIAYFL